MKRFIEHFKRWKSWRKYNANNKFYQLLVLFGIIVSPTFEFWSY